MLTLVIGNKNYSSWSLRGWLMLTKLGLEFEEIRIPLFTPDYEQRLLEYSPSGRVPVLLDGDVTVWDTLAIAAHLAESHPDLWPRGIHDRALARSVSAEMHAGFTALRTDMPMNCRATGRRVDVAAAVAGDIERIQAIWNHCLATSGSGQGWLFGDFTAADAMFAPVASRFHTYGIACPGPAGAYVDQVLDDEAVRAWYEAGREEVEVIDEEEVGQP